MWTEIEPSPEAFRQYRQGQTLAENTTELPLDTEL